MSYVYQGQDYKIFQATIANGAALSEVIPNDGAWPCVAIDMPAAWTTASLKIRAGDLASALTDCTDSSDTLVKTAVTAGVRRLSPFASPVFGAFLQLGSIDASNVAVNQGADRVFYLHFRKTTLG